MERLYPIKGFDKYMITKTGKVYSCYSKIFMKPHQNKDGYLKVIINNNNNKKVNKTIHRLLMENFVPNPENKKEVNHLDGNKQNNSLDNLEWLTRKENAQHASSLGLFNPVKTPMPGEKNGNSKLKEKDILEIRAAKGQVTQGNLAIKYGISKSQIDRIQNGHYWNHVKNEVSQKKAITKAGVNHYNSKLTEEDVLKIRELRGEMSQEKIGIMFGINQTTVSKLFLRKSWTHI
jgi:DNA-binding transcriptional regulator YiaG